MKEQAYRFCEQYIFGRLQRIKDTIQELQASLGSETKSSAGDKHETGRAMLQLEREKLGQQLLEAEKTLELLKKVNATKPTSVVSLGSLVSTTMGIYYIAISAGKFDNLGAIIYCISAITPIGKVLISKSEGDSFKFNGKEHKILKIN